jgi:hypothetical protein
VIHEVGERDGNPFMVLDDGSARFRPLRAATNERIVCSMRSRSVQHRTGHAVAHASDEGLRAQLLR